MMIIQSFLARVRSTISTVVIFTVILTNHAYSWHEKFEKKIYVLVDPFQIRLTERE